MPNGVYESEVNALEVLRSILIVLEDFEVCKPTVDPITNGARQGLRTVWVAASSRETSVNFLSSAISDIEFPLPGARARLGFVINEHLRNLNNFAEDKQRTPRGQSRFDGL